MPDGSPTTPARWLTDRDAIVPPPDCRVPAILQRQRGGHRDTRNRTEMKTTKKKPPRKRAKHSLPTRVFNYGARPPDDAAREIIFDQLVKMRDYKRSRALKVRDTRAAIDALRRGNFQGYDEALKAQESCESRISEIYESIRKDRSRVRKRVSAPELELEAEELKAQLSDRLWPAVKRERGEILKLHKPALEELSRRVRERAEAQDGSGNNHLKERLRAEALAEMLDEDWPETWKLEERLDSDELRHEKLSGAESGLFSGVKDWARADVRQAKSDTFGNGRKVSWPRELGGRVGLPIDGTVGTDGCSVVARGFSLTNAAPYSDDWRGRRRMVARFEFPIGREKHVVELRCMVHRPMPTGAKIARAWIQVGRSGSRFVYNVQLAVQCESLMRARAKRRESVSVKFVWSALPDGSLRVATLTGSDGLKGEVVLPYAAAQAFSYAERLQSFQKRHFNAAQRLCRKWLELTGEDDQELRDAASKRVRSPKRLCDYARRRARDIGDFEDYWRAWKAFCDDYALDYFPDGAMAVAAIREAFPEEGSMKRLALYLEFWRRKNEHLRKWEANQRRRAQRRRRDIYRNEAAKLAGRYDVWVSETKDGAVKRASRKKRTEEKSDGNEARITKQRRIAAKSELESALKSAFQ